MRAIYLFLLAGLIISGCTPGSNSNLKPRTDTNQAAMTNLNLAVEYMRRGEYEAALEKLNRAYRYDPHYYATHNTYGLLYQRLGDAGKAEEHFKRAIDLFPTDGATHNYYGQFLCQNKRFDQAEEEFLKAAKNPLYETPEIPLGNAGSCALMNKNPAQAETYFRQALEANPKLPNTLLQMSQLSFDKGNHLSARAYLQRYLEVGRHTPQSLWLGIQIERVLGDKNAVSSYTLLLRNNFPDSVEAGYLPQTTQKK